MFKMFRLLKSRKIPAFCESCGYGKPEFVVSLEPHAIPILELFKNFVRDGNALRRDYYFCGDCAGAYEIQLDKNCVEAHEKNLKI